MWSASTSRCSSSVDAIKFPDFVHANKPSPVTNVQDPSRAFDFFSNVPESTQMPTQL